jgi:hypothetical protein
VALYFFVGKKYGFSKGYPQRNAAYMGSNAAQWAAFLCGYPLLPPYFLPTKNAQRYAVLSWYMYSGASPSCYSCYVCTVMRVPIVAHMGSISLWISFASIFFAQKNA